MLSAPMPWGAVFGSDPWRRYVVQYFAAVCVRRVFLRVRFELHIQDLLTLSASSGKVAAHEYRTAAERYWAAYCFLRDTRGALDDEQHRLLLEGREAQLLLFATNCLQSRSVTAPRRASPG